MSTTATQENPPEQKDSLHNYPGFLWHAIKRATDGGPLFYGWMIFLTALALVGVNAWAHQVNEGLIVTNMTDQVSWGIYIANFTFLVGLAAGGVMMVIPTYLYHDEEMHKIVIIGELLAISSIIMCLLFVNVDLGRPDRIWHMMPFIGRFHWPVSMLSWDVIALSGYLVLNLHVAGYLLYMQYLKRKPNPRWYKPFVLLSIFWAISIHTVTAFLYSGLGGRPFWNTAILAPRFLTSAFVAGPAFIIVTLYIIRKFTKFHISKGPIKTLISVMKITILLNLFMLGSELFTDFYTGGSHAASAEYLFFGLHGHNALVPWIWTAISFNITSAILLFIHSPKHQVKLLLVACVLAFIGVWIEKGMGMIIPAFIPSTLHEIVEYQPSLTEWKVVVGGWAIGLLVFTASLKVALPVLSGEMTVDHEDDNIAREDRIS